MMGEEGKDKYFYAAEFVTCQKDILEALEVSCAKEWSVGKVEVEEAVREGEVRMKKGFLDGAIMLLERSILFGDSEGIKVWSDGSLRGQGHKNLGKVIQQVLMELEKNSEMDCGCG